jgi:hypothetical protein
MKTLKLARLLSMIAGLACFMIYCLPETNCGAGYDWAMIAVLILFLVVGPASLISNIKREEHPQTLTEYKKGYVIMCVILFVIVLSLCATALIARLGSLWLNLAFTFATLNHLFNAIILYKAKKAYDSKN